MVNGGYKVDLRELHALCEANYARVLRLFPEYESTNARQFALGAARIRVDVIERTRYTTVFRLQYLRGSGPDAVALTSKAEDEPASSEMPWLTALRIDARAYHDAGMLEVIDFAGLEKPLAAENPSSKPVTRRVQGRYPYPNPAMHQQDEKLQQNKFLADWLSHCLHHGEADLRTAMPADLEPKTHDSSSNNRGRKPGLKPGAEHA